MIALVRRVNLFTCNYTMLKDGREVVMGDGKARKDSCNAGEPGP